MLLLNRQTQHAAAVTLGDMLVSAALCVCCEHLALFRCAARTHGQARRARARAQSTCAGSAARAARCSARWPRRASATACASASASRSSLCCCAAGTRGRATARRARSTPRSTARRPRWTPRRQVPAPRALRHATLAQSMCLQTVQAQSQPSNATASPRIQHKGDAVEAAPCVVRVLVWHRRRPRPPTECAAPQSWTTSPMLWPSWASRWSRCTRSRLAGSSRSSRSMRRCSRCAPPVRRRSAGRLAAPHPRARALGVAGRASAAAADALA